MVRDMCRDVDRDMGGGIGRDMGINMGRDMGRDMGGDIWVEMWTTACWPTVGLPYSTHPGTSGTGNENEEICTNSITFKIA